ncbi:hypothetical protein NN561_019097 [Cricetulus griseus]
MRFLCCAKGLGALSLPPQELVLFVAVKDFLKATVPGDPALATLSSRGSGSRRFPKARGWDRLAVVPCPFPVPGRGDSCGEPAAGDPALCLQPRVGDVGVPVALATRPGGCTTGEEPTRKALGKARRQHPGFSGCLFAEELLPGARAPWPTL